MKNSSLEYLVRAPLREHRVSHLNHHALSLIYILYNGNTVVFIMIDTGLTEPCLDIVLPCMENENVITLSSSSLLFISRMERLI